MTLNLALQVVATIENLNISFSAILVSWKQLKLSEE